MRGSFQAILGVYLAILSSLVVLGSLMLSMVEGGRLVALQAPSATAGSSDEDLAGLIRLVPTSLVQASVASAEPAISLTALPTSLCPHDGNLIAYTVNSEVNIVDIARNIKIEPDMLRQINCLSTNRLAPGQVIYLPMPTGTPTAQPTSTPTDTQQAPSSKPKKTQVACGAPRGWVIYIVRRGDTLTNLALRLGTSVAQLQAANCMGRSTFLRAGQSLYVPFLPPQVVPPTPARPSPTPQVPTSTLPPPTQPPATQAPTSTPVPPTATQPPPQPTPTDPVITPPPTKEPPPTPLPPTAEPTPTPGLGQVTIQLSAIPF